MHGDGFAISSGLRSAGYSCRPSSRRRDASSFPPAWGGKQSLPPRSAAIKSARARGLADLIDNLGAALPAAAVFLSTARLRPNTRRQATCIRAAAKLLGGSPRDAACADLRARTGLAASSAPRATAETPYPRNGLTMGYPLSQVVPCPLRCVRNRAGRNRGHVVVPEAPRVAARTSGPAVDRRRHPSQCLIGRGTGPAPE
jgi:hypothetical protein